MLETIILIIAVLAVGGFVIQLVSGALRIGLIVVLAVVLFGGGWATITDWGNEVKDNVKISIKDDSKNDTNKPNPAKNNHGKKNHKQNNR